MKKLSITVRGDTLEELSLNVVRLGVELNSLGANTAAADPAPAKAAAAPAAPAKDKKTAAKEAKAATAANAADDDLGFVEESSEELGLDEEAEEVKRISKDDIIIAIRDFVKKDKEKNTPKIKTMLTKLGVKTGSVQDIQEKDYQKVMDQLTKAKG